jgi:hypothetical protein
MNDQVVEATFRADSPVSRWNVAVPVAGSEQRDIQSNGYGGAQGLFRTTRLSVLTTFSGKIMYLLSGPNIRQDGTPGARNRSREVSRAHVEETYPAALLVVQLMLKDGAERVMAQAQLAREQMNLVLQSETPPGDAPAPDAGFLSRELPPLASINLYDEERRTCPGGFDYAGHVCDDACGPGYPRLTEDGWQLTP